MFDGESCVRCEARFKFEELNYDGSGWGVCADCQPKVNPEAEPLRACPHDNQQMRKKVINHQVMIDRCSTCGGVWLDGDEIEVLKKMVERQKSDYLYMFLLPVIFGLQQ